MGNVPDKSCTENQNIAYFTFNNFFVESRAVYEIMWQNITERGRLQMSVRIMRNACWITKATDTHPEHVTLISFHCNNSYTYMLQCYVVITLPLLLPPD